MEASPQIKAKIKQEVGDYLIEKVLTTVGASSTPVKGESWKKLSKDYKKLKLSEGGSGEADMELKGDMLDDLTFRNTKEGIELGFFSGEAWKADGHLKFSGAENNTPKRRFLPGEGQSFKSDIERGVEEIIADNLADAVDIKKSELKDVETKSDLYSVLAKFFEGMARAEIKAAILRTPKFANMLDDLDLLELL